MATSILAWRIPWTKEPGGLQSMGSQKGQTHPKCLSSSSRDPSGKTPWPVGLGPAFPEECSLGHVF